MSEIELPIRVFAIEDEELSRTAFCMLLSNQIGLKLVGAAPTLETAADAVQKNNPNVILVKLDASDERSLIRLKAFAATHEQSAVIVLLEHLRDEVIYELLSANIYGICSSKISVSSLLNGIQAAANHCLWLGPTVALSMREILANLARLKAAHSERGRLTNAALTERESEILACLSRGMTNQQIAAHLVLSVETVKTYVRRIMDKSSIRTRRELISVLSSRSAC